MGGPEEPGTLWVVADDDGHFNSGHSRVLTELTKFAGIAIRTHRTGQRLQQALEHQETLTREMRPEGVAVSISVPVESLN